MFLIVSFPIRPIAEDGCLEEFENTAAFSREYQAAQDCMCDTEHMVTEALQIWIKIFGKLIFEILYYAVRLPGFVDEQEQRQFQEPRRRQHGGQGNPQDHVRFPGMWSVTV